MQLSYDYAKDRVLMCLRANYESHLGTKCGASLSPSPTRESEYRRNCTSRISYVHLWKGNRSVTKSLAVGRVADCSLLGSTCARMCVQDGANASGPPSAWLLCVKRQSRQFAQNQTSSLLSCPNSSCNEKSSAI